MHTGEMENNRLPEFPLGEITVTMVESTVLGYFEASEIENDQDRPKIETVISVDEKGLAVIRLFPNTVSDQLTIDIDEPSKTSVGQRFARLSFLISTEKTFNLSDLPASCYLIKVQLDSDGYGTV